MRPTNACQVPVLSREKKIRLQAIRDYYENKIQCLELVKNNATLLRMACWDTPFEKTGLRDLKTRKKFLKMCLKYYKNKLKEVGKKLRDLK